MTPWSFRWFAALVLFLAVFAVVVSAQRFDSNGRLIVPPTGESPLLAGPPNPGSWRVRRTMGQQFPLRVDTRLLFSEPTTFRLVLPRLGAPGNNAVVIVDDVRNDAAAIGSAVGRSLPGMAAPVAYSGNVRGSASGLVVLSVLGGVFYGRVVLRDEAWTLYSSAGGLVYVEISSPASGVSPLPSGLLERGDPASRRRPRRR